MKTRSYFQHILAALLFTPFIFSSCKKDQPQLMGGLEDLVWEDPDCNDSFISPETGVSQHKEEGNQYKYPTFNPNNQYELVYYEVEADSGSSIQTSHKLVKYNYNLDMKTILVQHVKVVGQPAWNDDGWIAFKRSETGLIHLIKEDGSAYSQFNDIPTGSNRNENLTWLNGGNQLIWGNINPNAETYLYTKTIGDTTQSTYFHEQGAVFDRFSVSSDSVLITPFNETISKVDFKLDSSYFHYNINPIDGRFHDGLTWRPDNDKFYVSKTRSAAVNDPGLFEVDNASGNWQKLIQYCDKAYISHISCSPNGDKIVFQKLDRAYTSGEGPFTVMEGTIIENSTLWLLDLNTLKAAKLPLDE